MIGTITPAEWSDEIDQLTGRAVRRYTDGRSNSYPLYYFTPSITADGRYLVFHSERSGEVQLYRLDLVSGEIGQLTDGHTYDSGWAIWCVWHLDGIFTHLSALHPTNGEVWYFQDADIRATHVTSFADRRVADLPAGRISVGQSAFSPDGKWFAYIHCDAVLYRRLMADREQRLRAGTFDWTRDHQAFRSALPATLELIETATGLSRAVVVADYHFHHVLFVDNTTMLVNHPKSTVGMWVVNIDGSGVRQLRPDSAPGAHDSMVNHQVITARGIAYEAVAYHADGSRDTYLGRYDFNTDRFAERHLPTDGYVHVGWDPAGRLDFVENAGREHAILLVQSSESAAASTPTEVLRLLHSPDHNDQRHHAHPFLAPDRERLFFTDWSDSGHAQICSIDVRDVVAAADARFSSQSAAARR